MIWINISNILKVSKFSGIARTEYELCVYAYQLSQNGHLIKFSTFDDRFGFLEVDSKTISQVLHNLKNGSVSQSKKIKLKQKILNSTLKRITKLKIYCGIVRHCFNENDVIFCVGQNVKSNEIWAFDIIKSKVNFKLKFMCHDLIPINHPEFFTNSHNLNIFAKYMNQLVKVVDHFYCNSNYTKKELIEYYKKNDAVQPPMSVVTLGCDLYKKQIGAEKENLLKIIISEPYLLFVSTIEIRKNHSLIYQMYLKLIEQGVENLPKIYFVGRRGWKVDALLKDLDNDERIKNKIIILENISDSELINLYTNCWFTLFPSFIEGYGLPIAESLSFGKFCLSSNTGSLTEVGGDFIDYADPYQLTDWAERFLFLINNPTYVKKKEQKIIDAYIPTSWEQCSSEILKSELI